LNFREARFYRIAIDSAEPSMRYGLEANDLLHQGPGGSYFGIRSFHNKDGRHSLTPFPQPARLQAGSNIAVPLPDYQILFFNNKSLAK
jgi:hypothetical protein